MCLLHVLPVLKTYYVVLLTVVFSLWYRDVSPSTRMYKTLVYRASIVFHRKSAAAIVPLNLIRYRGVCHDAWSCSGRRVTMVLLLAVFGLSGHHG